MSPQEAVRPVRITAAEAHGRRVDAPVASRSDIRSRATLLVNEHPAFTMNDPDIAEWVARDLRIPPSVAAAALAAGPKRDWREEPGYGVSDIRNMTIPGARWLIENTVRAGTINAFTGANKAGKSRLALHAIESLVTGAPFLGEHAVPAIVPVVLFASDDDSNELLRVSKEWFEARPLPDHAPFEQRNNTGLDLMNARDVGDLSAWLRERSPIPGLVVLDSGYNFAVALDDNDRAAVKRLYGNVKALCEEVGCAVLIVEHAAKAAGEGSHAVIGSQAKGAQIRSGVTVILEDDEHVRPDGRSVSLVKLKRWGNAGRPWKGTYEHDGSRFTWTRTEDVNEAAREALFREIDAALAGGDAVPLDQVEPNKNKRTALRRDLTDAGYTIERKEQGGKLHVTGRDVRPEI